METFQHNLNKTFGEEQSGSESLGRQDRAPGIGLDLNIVSGGKRASLMGKMKVTLSMDAWNQSSAEEVSITVRNAASESELNDASLKICTCFTPWDKQTSRVYPVLGAAPTLSANFDKSGINRQAFLCGQTDKVHAKPKTQVAFQQNTREEVRLVGGDGQTAGAILAELGSHKQNFIASIPNRSEADSGEIKTNHDMKNTTTTERTEQMPYMPTSKYLKPEYLECMSRVRRLTPREADRLMSFPEDYTSCGGTVSSDSCRFKQAGNSWMSNEARYVSIGITRELRNRGIERAIKYATTSSGVECQSIAVKGLGWSPIFFSEIDKPASYLLGHYYPSVPNLGDMTKIKFDEKTGTITNELGEGEEDDLPKEFLHAPVVHLPVEKGSVHVFSGGTPCFCAGTMVLTESGYKPIEEIKVGERVMTHHGRLRKVLRTGHKNADNVVSVKFSSRPAIRCTSDHKFWAADNPHLDFRRHSDTYLKLLFDGVSFREISKVGEGGYVAQLREYEAAELPKFPKVYNASSLDIVELAGWYVGDGHCAGFSNKKHKKVLIFSLSEKKLEAFKKRFEGVFDFTCHLHDKNGVWRVQVPCAELCDWLVGNFGHLSYNKTIPAWLIMANDDVKSAFNAGYMATDGFVSEKENITSGLSSTSFSLALGMADFWGKSCVYECKVPPTKKMYDGRIVNQRHFWSVKRSNKPDRFHDYEKWSLVRVHKIIPQEAAEVYNIEVEEDHSYIIHGICVKNCQDYSVAGKRAGGAEGSGTRSSLAFHFLRIAADELESPFLVWENVCFAPKTLVTTEDGHKKISEIKVGDKVRSLDGKCHEVICVMKHEGKKTIRVNVMGAEDIEVTPNHPFLARVDLHNDGSNSRRKFSTPAWLPAGQLTKDHYIGYKLDKDGTESIGMANAYAVGRWLADGSIAIRRSKTHNVSRGGQRCRFLFSVGHKKVAHLRHELSKLPYNICESKIKDYAINLTFTSDEFYELIKECGRGAQNKRVPQYVYRLIPEEQKEVLRGYFDGDGSLHNSREMTFSTSSKELALGLARLVRDTYRRGVSIRFNRGKGSAIIKGRKVNANDFWSCSFVYTALADEVGKNLISFAEDGYVWCPVKKVSEEEGVRTVYNLTVADTHTYEANDVVVHNCGALSANGGKDFAWFLYRCMEKGYNIAYRVLDGQYVMTDKHPRATPQRRRRIWLVGYRGDDWRVPVRVLFQPLSALGDEPPDRVVGKGWVKLNKDFDRSTAVVLKTGRQSKKSEDKKSGSSSGNGGGVAMDLFSMMGCQLDAKKTFAQLAKGLRDKDLTLRLPNENDIRKVKAIDLFQVCKGLGKIDDGKGFVGELFGNTKRIYKTVQYAEIKELGEGFFEVFESAVEGASTFYSASSDKSSPYDPASYKDAKDYQRKTVGEKEIEVSVGCDVGHGEVNHVTVKVMVYEDTFVSEEIPSDEKCVDTLNWDLLHSFGNAGILSNGRVVTMTCPEWTAGLTEETLAEMDEELRSLYDGEVCGLSDILVDDPDPKYDLTWRSCWGILVRASKRGKELHELLFNALLAQICLQPERVKWAMLYAKKEEERERAKSCWDGLIALNPEVFLCPLDEIEAEPPPKRVGANGAEEESEDEDEGEIDESELGVDDGEGVMEDCGE